MIILQWYLKQKNKATKGTGLKILTSKQMLQFNSENLLNEIRQIVYSLYQSKEITKKSI